MIPREIKDIFYYVIETEKALGKLDEAGLRAELLELDRVIGVLIDAGLKTKDQIEQVLLDSIKSRAQKCRKHIQDQLRASDC